jgi:hypothetical protein
MSHPTAQSSRRAHPLSQSSIEQIGHLLFRSLLEPLIVFIDFERLQHNHAITIPQYVIDPDTQVGLSILDTRDLVSPRYPKIEIYNYISGTSDYFSAQSAK